MDSKLFWRAMSLEKSRFFGTTMLAEDLGFLALNPGGADQQGTRGGGPFP